MKFLSFLSISFLLLFTSCSNNYVDFNDKLVEIQKQVLPKFKALTENMASGLEDTTKVVAILAEADVLQKFTKAKVTEMNKLVVPSGGERLKSAFSAQFQFVLDLIVNLKKINNKALPESEVINAANWMVNFGKLNENLHNELVAAQQAFAKDKGFKIQ